MKKIIKDFIKKSLEEDVGQGDLTSNACITKGTIGEAKLITKEACYISGINLAQHIYEFYDENLIFKSIVNEGQFVKKNDIIFTIQGNKHAILATERLILNCMQRMSGITTKTREFVKAVKNYNVKILDTRKTCPTIRFLDKEAVRLGGGHNHRFGLYDEMMIKDNHIDFSGGIENAIKNCQIFNKKINKEIPIIVEVRNFNELNKVLNIGGINRILLDNFSIQMTKDAVDRVNNLIPLESSGNINIKNVKKYAKCGVNFISIGSLTHSVKSIDLSMLST
ncbi:MAG: nicotinate-nucleotide diphosphorylase (carboxylating) [Flavobacteriales bacterium]|nr:nicotinate-nucleotide diphosphorylase (carboxylating) [Flavobacteriales bacterium]|tara:strand:- start:748 stop:1587 length:840 start_codon:yes stop_codon:yes gene_type:complete